jgi:DNA-binding response OmpR family regulator
MKKRVLIVDDERNVRLTYRVTLETEGYEITEAVSGVDALEKLKDGPFGLAILDLRMPEMDGLTLLHRMREANDNTPVIIITAFGDVPHAVEAMKLGAIDFLQKPIRPEELRTVTEDIFVRHAGPKIVNPEDEDTFHHHFSEAKRLINLQIFGAAWRQLSRAIELDPRSPDALNLAGVLFEMQKDYERARKLYGKAIKYGPYHEPAQQNMRRLFELFNFGASNEPFNLGE